jgi:Ger(x)C family germination protein
MITKFSIKTGIKAALLSLFLLCTAFFSTGCSDMLEIQDRDFVLALGLSYTDQYKVTFSLPDLDAITGQSKKAIDVNSLRSLEASSLPEIESMYNLNSQKHLDYRHLEAIIVDSSMISQKQKFEDLLRYADQNYDISRNVLVYYYPKSVQDLFILDENLGGSVGNFLKKLNKNNNTKQPTTLGTLIDGLENQGSMLLPALVKKNNSISLDGALLYQSDKDSKIITEEEYELYNLMLGKDTDYLFNFDDTVLKLKDITCKRKYVYENQKPVVYLNIKGNAEYLQYEKKIPSLIDKLNGVIQNHMEAEITSLMKKDRFDFLHLYELSSYKNRDIWVAYRGNMEAFIQDIEVKVSLDIR